MALQDYQVTAAGHRRIMHNGVIAHSGRLVNMDSANAVTALLIKAGYITATLTSSTHDVAANTPIGQQSAEGLHTYTVTAAGANKINHNGVTLAQGATLNLDPQDDTAAFYVAKGYIA